MTYLNKKGFAALVMLALATPALAGGAAAPAKPVSIEEVQKTQFVDAKGIAINGYDPVSFFKGQGKPGDARFAAKYHGATYLFATAANKASFTHNAAAYVPQYGGYCAYGTAVERKFRTQPETGTVIGGKLYFNKDKSVQAKWNENTAKYIKDANGNWAAVQKRDIDG